MENLFNKIATDFNYSSKDTLKKDPSNKLNNNIKGSTNAKIHLNENGDYYYNITKYCAGITISLNFSILNPDDTYNIKIHSSDGGNYIFENIKTNQILNCSLNTSFWYSTKFTINIHANNSHNTDSEALIEYTF